MEDEVKWSRALDDDGPLLCTVEEAAQVLRIGRSLAYTLTRQYLESGGTQGIPVIRFGSCLRVPVWALVVLANTGRVVDLCADGPGAFGGDRRSTSGPAVDAQRPRRGGSRRARAGGRGAASVGFEQLVLLPPG